MVSSCVCGNMFTRQVAVELALWMTHDYQWALVVIRRKPYFPHIRHCLPRDFKAFLVNTTIYVDIVPIKPIVLLSWTPRHSYLKISREQDIFVSWKKLRLLEASVMPCQRRILAFIGNPFLILFPLSRMENVCHHKSVCWARYYCQ